MASDEGRSQRLGDVGENSPSRWKWGRKGAEPHLLLMLYADCADIEAFAAATVAGLGQSCELLQPQLDCSDGGSSRSASRTGSRSPGIDWDGERTPGGTADQIYTNWVSAGEVLLGYLDEYNLVSDRPSSPPLCPAPRACRRASTTRRPAISAATAPIWCFAP